MKSNLKDLDKHFWKYLIILVMIIILCFGIKWTYCLCNTSEAAIRFFNNSTMNVTKKYKNNLERNNYLESFTVEEENISLNKAKVNMDEVKKKEDEVKKKEDEAKEDEAKEDEVKKQKDKLKKKEDEVKKKEYEVKKKEDEEKAKMEEKKKKYFFYI